MAASEEATALWASARNILLQANPPLSVRDRSVILDITPLELFDSLMVVATSNDYIRTAAERLSGKINDALSEAAHAPMKFVVSIKKPENDDEQKTPAKPVTTQQSDRQQLPNPNFARQQMAYLQGQSQLPNNQMPGQNQPFAHASYAQNYGEPQQFAQGSPLPQHSPDASSDTANAGTPSTAPSPANLAHDQNSLSNHLSSGHFSSTRDEKTHLNLEKTFDNFVPGESNSFARAAAEAVAEAPGTSYNPLFIYGGSGLGKTHLLNAIGNYAMQLYPTLNIRYVTSEEFTNEFIEAVKDSTGKNGQVTEFNRRYRSFDLLLIDDIQFLGGKTATLEAFFHTFNELFSAGKQIVIASDVPPQDLPDFEDRLVSRFAMGLPVDVQPPNQETRIAILQMKAAEKKMSIPPEVIELIASQVTDSIRLLEGALVKIDAAASLNKQQITVQLAEQVLRDFFIQNVEITPTDIIAKTATYFQLDFDDLVSAKRSKRIAQARQVAMYICREMTGLSLTNIGEIFGGRDHTTVIHACQKISSEMSEKREIYNYVNEITTDLKRIK